MSRGKYSTRGKYEESEVEGGATLAQGTLAGRGGASGAGVYEQIAAGTNLSFSGTTLNAAGGVGGGVTVADEDSFFLAPHGLFQAGVSSFFLDPSARVYTTRFWLPYEFKFDQFIFYVAIAGTVDAVVVVGIYSNDGNTLEAEGSSAALATGEKTVTLGAAVTLSGGYYILAAGSESTGNRPYIQGFTASAQIWSALNTSCSNGVFGYGTNTISGGAMPATLGALTNRTTVAPWVVLGGSS